MAKDFQNGWPRVRAAAVAAGIIQGDEGDDAAGEAIAKAIEPEVTSGTGEDVPSTEPDAGSEHDAE